MASTWNGELLGTRPDILAPIAHWTIDTPAGDDSRQHRDHPVTCKCRKTRTYHFSGECPKCRPITLP